MAEQERELNVQLQTEEIEVLQSIYEGAFQLKANFDDAEGVRAFTIAIPGRHAIQLLIHLPFGYPTTDAPVAEVYESFGLTNAQRDQILQDLNTIFQRSSGQVCLYEWIESVREVYANDEDVDLSSLSISDSKGTRSAGVQEASHGTLEQVQEEDDVPPVSFVSDPQTLRPRVRTAQLVRDPEREARLAPLIFHGKPFTDRKSTFQGHACPVHSVEDVRSFLAILMDDRKIERAIHNMLAYRIVGDFVIKDNDEDGEDAAGSKLSHLLELTKVENVAVVVTRWFGGILLGPDRFKHINTAARETLEEGGFLAASTLNHSKKKTKK
ncbi:Impact-like protein, partial [Globisporangium splendens]